MREKNVFLLYKRNYLLKKVRNDDFVKKKKQEIIKSGNSSLEGTIFFFLNVKSEIIIVSSREMIFTRKTKKQNQKMRNSLLKSRVSEKFSPKKMENK